MKLVFKHSRYRKDKSDKTNFNPELSRYWNKQYEDMFKKWRTDGNDRK